MSNKKYCEDCGEWIKYKSDLMWHKDHNTLDEELGKFAEEKGTFLK